MQELIGAIEAVIALPQWRAAVLADAPAIAQQPQAALGVFMGYDFHIGPHGPQLIEINTNAGGALLNIAVGNAQRACCTEVEKLVTLPLDIASLDRTIFAMFQNEWRLARGDQPLRRIAIVDTDPPAQYLYPEFLLAQRLFEAQGVAAVIADPSELEYRDGRLLHGGDVIDLVYNRLTDFYLEAQSSAALRGAYEHAAAVITPHPHAHALYANKRNLVLLSDSALMRSWGVAEDTIALLEHGIPRTIRVVAELADLLWQQRRQWFFKPSGGFGSRGAYRGDKLTRKVFEDIIAGDYVAQAMAAPGERRLSHDQPLKFDLRNYSYDAEVQLVAARLYQGQTTNFRTPGGGFAPVYHPPAQDLDCAALQTGARC